MALGRRRWVAIPAEELRDLRALVITALEIGRHDPSLSTLVKLATGLKVPVGELLE